MRINKFAKANGVVPFDEWFLSLDKSIQPRIYWGKEKDDTIVLLSAGDKSTQKSDIKLAQKYWEEYNA